MAVAASSQASPPQASAQQNTSTTGGGQSPAGTTSTSSSRGGGGNRRGSRSPAGAAPREGRGSSASHREASSEAPAAARVKAHHLVSLSHFEAKGRMAEATIETLADFIEAFNRCDQKILFRYREGGAEEGGNTQDHFLAFVESGVLLRFPSLGFKNLTDLEAGTFRKLTPEEFYDKLPQFPSFEHFDADRRGFRQVDDLRAAIKHHYEGALAKARETGSLPESALEGLERDADLFYKVKDEGWYSLENMRRGLASGFEDSKTWGRARELGFEMAKDMTEAETLGLDSPADLEVARTHKLKTALEVKLHRFKEEFGDMVKDHKLAGDQSLLIQHLASLPQGAEISLDDMEGYLNRLETPPPRKKLPKTYKKSLKSREDIHNFLQESELVRQYGRYSTTARYFKAVTPAKVSSSRFVIDGSNVAWAGRDRQRGERARAQQVIDLLHSLEEAGVHDYKIFCDSALAHQIEDQEAYHRLRRLKLFHEAPSRTAADEFIIEYARQNNAYMITNDMFRDWRQSDKWLADNFEQLRIPFMFVDGEVQFGGRLQKTQE